MNRVLNWWKKLRGVDEKTKERDIFIYGNHFEGKMWGIVWVRLDPSRRIMCVDERGYAVNGIKQIKGLK